jgi:hypothetical protein
VLIILEWKNSMAAKKSPGKSPKKAPGNPAPLSDAALDKVAGGAGPGG